MASARRGILAPLEWAAVIVLGLLLGSALGALAGETLAHGPVLQALLRTWPLGVSPPFTLDLTVLSITLGFTLRVGLCTVLGLLAAVALYVKLR
jgi:hypothetical protein